MHIPVHLSAGRTVRGLFMFLAMLLFFHLVVVVGHFQFHCTLGAMTELFDMDREANLPALFNVLLFFIGGAFFHVMGYTVEGKARRPWNLMALVFVFLGIDEGSQIHEKLMLVTLRLMNHGTLGGGHMGWLYYAWTIPYGIAALVLVALLGPWLVKLEPRTRWGLLGSGAVYLFGAVFLEACGGDVAEKAGFSAGLVQEPAWLPCIMYPPGQCFLYDNAAYVGLYTVEESAEMAGLILCIGVLMRALERSNARVEVTVGER